MGPISAFLAQTNEDDVLWARLCAQKCLDDYDEIPGLAVSLASQITHRKTRYLVPDCRAWIDRYAEARSNLLNARKILRHGMLILIERSNPRAETRIECRQLGVFPTVHELALDLGEVLSEYSAPRGKKAFYESARRISSVRSSLDYYPRYGEDLPALCDLQCRLSEEWRNAAEWLSQRTPAEAKRLVTDIEPAVNVAQAEQKPRATPGAKNKYLAAIKWVNNELAKRPEATLEQLFDEFLEKNPGFVCRNFDNFKAARGRLNRKMNQQVQ